MVVGLFFVLVFGLGCGLVFGLVVGLVETFKGAEIDTRTGDNQGIRLSIFNSMIFGIIFTPLGVLIPTAFHLFVKPSTLPEILAQGAAFGFLYGFLLGGLGEAIAHLALRFTLWKFGYSPWNYSKFLRYCTRLGFLQRVGGGYRFTHALLRDHLAEYHNTVRPLKPTR